MDKADPGSGLETSNLQKLLVLLGKCRVCRSVSVPRIGSLLLPAR